MSARRRILLLALTAAGCAAAVAGCGSAGVASDDGRLQVGTTVAPITSIAANIGGDRVKITGIVPEGTNSHTFEPKPSDAELLARIDVLYVNGLKLDEPTTDLAKQNMKDGAQIVEVGTKAIAPSRYIYDFSFPKSGGKPNPHLWTDPRYALRYAQIISADLSRRHPADASYFAANLAKFTTKIAAFDKAMRTSFASIPRAKRRLLTYHDAYAYFGRDYGWDIIGAIQVTDFEDPTAKEVAGLIDQVRQTKVPAIFGSEVFPSPVLKQIGNEAGVKYVDVLRDDDLPGKPGDPQHSWMGLMRFDYVTMTEAMGGDAQWLRAFQAGNVAPDTASYPQ
ncbi:MAG: manganese transport system substrate-binding protein [Solirubrobacteraceae bacterium]|jgi:ABC-type Zn uptake system ZnuABC Zn-binding protein ZnuA|nr:manganese transport system substrate-binding protein [Solirubrobacteraceae bacterium]